jgi:cyd operon protein YbgT
MSKTTAQPFIDRERKGELFSIWYFSWVLGVSFAVSFSIINALWLEARGLADTERTVNTGEGL